MLVFESPRRVPFSQRRRDADVPLVDAVESADSTVDNVILCDYSVS